jgi:hypothetical protein
MKAQGSGLLFIITLAAIILVAAFAPLEKTLGTNIRIVYLHGAWVWVALFLFLLAAISGLVALLARRDAIHRWSRALGRTGLLFWIAFLPQSLFLMQANWNGLFLEEPRFRIPLNYAIVGLLLQAGVSFFPLQWTSWLNLAFGVALFSGMSGMQTVLHPDSPVFSSGSLNIQLFFAALLGLLAAAGLQIARWWKVMDGRSK